MRILDVRNNILGVGNNNILDVGNNNIPELLPGERSVCERRDCLWAKIGSQFEIQPQICKSPVRDN